MIGTMTGKGKALFLATTVLTTVAFGSEAFAGAFGLREQSGTYQGMVFSGVAAGGPSADPLRAEIDALPLEIARHHGRGTPMPDLDAIRDEHYAPQVETSVRSAGVTNVLFWC